MYAQSHAVSVATLWVFSQDLGFFDPILGSGFFSRRPDFFYGFSKVLGFFVFFNILR